MLGEKYFNREKFEKANKRKYNVYNLDKPKEFIEDYLLGLTDPELAEKHDVSWRTVGNYLKQLRDDEILPYRKNIDFSDVKEEFVEPKNTRKPKIERTKTIDNLFLDSGRHMGPKNEANLTKSELVKLLNIHRSRTQVAQKLGIPFKQISDLVDHYEILDSKKLSEKLNDSLKEILSDYLPIQPKIKYTKRGVSIALLVSDWHVGKEIRDEKGNLIYDIATFNKRIDIIIEELFKIIDRHLKSHLDIEEAVILAVGDLSNGEQIYPHQVYEQSVTPPKQVMVAARAFMKIINSLLDRGIPVRLKGVKGNHGRSGKDTDPESNWDLMIYMILEFWKKINNIEDFSIEYSTGNYLNTQIRGWNYHLRHSAYSQDETAAGAGKFKGWKDIHNADLIVSGHYHHYDINERKIMGSSLCGHDGLAERMAVTTGVPAQLLWVVSEEHSHTNVFPIEVGKNKP